MDEIALRERLDRVADSGPLIGLRVADCLAAGIRLRRRRRVVRGAGAAIVVVMAGAIPVLVAESATPAPVSPANGRIAYIATVGGTVVPVDTRTGKTGRPIRVQADVVAATPNGRTVYALSGYGRLRPIRTPARTVGKYIKVSAAGPGNVVIPPNGKTAYVLGGAGVLPVSTATNRAGKLIKVSGVNEMAFSPDGRTAYAITFGGNPDLGRTVTPIQVATSTVLRPIKVRVSATAPSWGFLDSIAITPNGRTAYVVDGVQEGKQYANSVTPVSLTTGTSGRAIRLRASGLADGIVMASDGEMAYVLSSKAVTPIRISTNTALAPIRLPAAEGNAYGVAMTPNGKTIYVISPRGITVISTARRAVIKQLAVPGLDGLMTPMAITPDGSTLLIGARNGVIEIPTATNILGPYIRLSTVPGKGRPFSYTFAR